MDTELTRSKALWRDFFALSVLADAERFLTLIEVAAKNGDDSIKWPLWIAFIVSYSKPFTSNNDMGCISAKLIPKPFRDLHAAYTKARDRLYGHTDPLETLEDGAPANQIILKKIGSSGFIMAEG